ncbi:PAS domain-containing protein [Paracoccus sp. (in: a-proteobacteria)]|uniref:PAS domain-containing protein n=1 Tax=Paracoccus sp. TaxID=267 RepID=UPI002AFE8A69|nr:PAS domain-containing protein [Paracoccus sp. (in: a-proteobacteria)]
MTEIHRLHHDLEWAMRAMDTHRAVLILDLAGHIVAVNHRYLAMCGYQRAELIGRPVAVLLDPSERGPNRLWRMLAAEDGREARLHDLAQIAKSGRRFCADARICQILDDKGRVCLNVLFLREAAEGAGLPPLEMPQAAGMAQVIRLPARAAGSQLSRRGGWDRTGADVAIGPVMWRER